MTTPARRLIEELDVGDIASDTISLLLTGRTTDTVAYAQGTDPWTIPALYEISGYVERVGLEEFYIEDRNTGEQFYFEIYTSPKAPEIPHCTMYEAPWHW